MEQRYRITIHWSRDNTCYARIYDAYGLMVRKITGFKRVVDLENRAVTEFENLFPGEYANVHRPGRLE